MKPLYNAIGPTPVWCKVCQMWVPAEHEPHRSARITRYHYAADQEPLHLPGPPRGGER